MAVLDIVLYPDAPLTEKAELVTEFDGALHTLADNMLETMYAYVGVGLAAPQVGVSKRLFVLDDQQQEPMCFVNPELSNLEGSEEGEEGCLSLPEVFAQVKRATSLHVKAQDLDGNPFEMEAEGFLARIIQHENDHLDGKPFIDRLDILTREVKFNEWTEVRARLLAAAGR